MRRYALYRVPVLVDDVHYKVCTCWEKTKPRAVELCIKREALSRLSSIAECPTGLLSRNVCQQTIRLETDSPVCIIVSSGPVSSNPESVTHACLSDRLLRISQMCHSAYRVAESVMDWMDLVEAKGGNIIYSWLTASAVHTEQRRSPEIKWQVASRRDVCHEGKLIRRPTEVVAVNQL